MRKWITAFLIFFPFLFHGQQSIQSTEQILIRGEVQQQQTICLADLKNFKIRPIKDVIITNHRGEKKGTATALKGVPLKDLLSSVNFKVENPKQLSELYLVFIASDGYKVVYSWNEIFNTATGDNTYLVTEKEGKEIQERNERVLLLTVSDYKTGRRYIKGLSEIAVERVR